MSETHYRCLERIYLQAPTNRYYHPELRIEQGKATVTIEVRDEFHHAAGAVHGSVYFKAMDDAAFFAANSLVEDVFVLTANFNIQFHRPVVSGSLTAYGEVVERTRRLVSARTELRDDAGRLLASGMGGFMPSRIALDSVPGYPDPDPA